jgi:hypothetical protein
MGRKCSLFLAAVFAVFVFGTCLYVAFFLNHSSSERADVSRKVMVSYGFFDSDILPKKFVGYPLE